MFLLVHAYPFYTFFMSLQEYYEDSYRGEGGRIPRDFKDDEIHLSRGLYNYVLECKDRFLAGKDWENLKILELGSGRGGLGLLLARLGANVTLVDFSATAIQQAETMFQEEGFTVTTLVADVTHPDVKFQNQFDIIVDSHLLHCLTDDPDRASYYGLVMDHLKPDGIFVAETMVHRKKLFIPDGFMFDQRNVLWQMFGKWTAVRRILDSLDLEQEILSTGFHITFFNYYGQFGFVPHRSFMDIPAEILPAAVRMVLQRK